MKGFNTRSIHEGEEEKVKDAVTMPIFQTSNFLADDSKYASERSETFYTRVGNPTIGVLERKLASLFAGTGGVFFSSGMGAITTVFHSFLKHGDNIVVSKNVYGGTQSLLRELPDEGVEVRRFDQSDYGSITGLIDGRTRIVYVESMVNPNLILTDIEAVKAGISSSDALLVVDNTFLSPYNFRPLEFGADVDIQSLTKYINGHSDVVAGFAGFKNPETESKVRRKMVQFGTNGAPFDAFLVNRGVKTLGPRMEIHNRNALAIANYLKDRPEVLRVSYPGPGRVPDCYGNCPGFGGVVYFEMRDRETAKRFMRSCSIFQEATSLAGVESLVTVPSLTSHASFKESELAEAGISPGGIRLSAGIEDIQDLIEDIKWAIKECVR